MIIDLLTWHSMINLEQGQSRRRQPKRKLMAFHIQRQRGVGILLLGPKISVFLKRQSTVGYSVSVRDYDFFDFFWKIPI